VESTMEVGGFGKKTVEILAKTLDEAVNFL
jgi:hypothetical protein